MVTGNLEVLAAWKSYVVKLGKDDFPSSSDRAIKDDDVFDDGAARAILARIRSTLDPQGRLLELSNRVTWEEVHAAVRALDAGKSPGPDGVPSELLRLAGVAFEMALVALFNEIWSTLRWPSQWSLASLVPLYKGDGDKLDPANSRTIALMSMLPKVFEKVLDKRLRSWAERVGGVSELQGGFRQDRSCPDQIFSLLEIISSRQEEKIDTYTCFLDVTKAYDRVWKPGLYYKLKEAGLNSETLFLLAAMMRKVVRRVVLDGSCSDQFPVEVGVPQGSVLSPWLYSMYIDGLHGALRSKGLGVWVFGRLVPLLLFADDIVLMAGSPQELDSCLKVAHEYARLWRFQFNHRKCNVVAFGSEYAKKVAQARVWVLGEGVIQAAASYKYLGCELGGGSFRGRWNIMLDRVAAAAAADTCLLVHRSGGSDGLRPKTLAALWKGEVRPRMEYACELWEGEISAKRVAALESVQNRFGRMSLGLKTRPAAVAVRAELGLSSLRSRRCCRKLLYWGKLCRVQEDRLLGHIFKNRLRQVQAGGGRQSCLQAFRATLSEFGLSASWLSGSVNDPNAWSRTCRDATQQAELLAQRAEIMGSPSLSIFRYLGQESPMGPNPYLLDRSNGLGTRLKACLRFGTLWLMNRVAAAVKGSAVLAQCRLCGSGEVEDAMHFVLRCPALASTREDFVTALSSVLPQAGHAGRVVLRVMVEAMRDDPEVALLLIAGLRPEVPCPSTGLSCQAEESAKAMWLLDKVVKNFLVRCWRVRLAVVGRIRVVRQRLVWLPAMEPHQLRPFLAPRSGVEVGGDGCRLWMEWGYKAPSAGRGPSHRRRNFFVAHSKNESVLCYRWCDAEKLAGSGCVIRGYDSLSEAVKERGEVYS